MKRIFYLFVALCIFISGCAGGTATSRIENTYPSSKYLTAKGLGQSEGEARNQAVAELSRIFESKVASDTLDRVKSIIDTSGSETSEQKIESSIRVISVVTLKGVQIAETWFDDERGVYYAFAVLDRFQARDTWNGEIRDTDRMIEAEMKVFDSETSSLLRLKSLQKVLDFWLEREVVVSRLRVLGFQGSITPPYDIRTVFRMIPEMKRNLLIFVHLEGKHAQLVENEVAGLLSKKGYMLSNDQSKANVLITGTIEVKPVDLTNPGWEFARAIAAVTIKDVDTGVKAGKISENTRVGHLTYDEAVHKAVKKVSARISDRLISYFED